MPQVPELLITAKKEVEKILDGDPQLSRPENRMLRGILQGESPSILDF